MTFTENVKRYPRWNKPFDFDMATIHRIRKETGDLDRPIGRRATRRAIIEAQERIQRERETNPHALPAEGMTKFMTYTTYLSGEPFPVARQYDLYDLFEGCYR